MNGAAETYLQSGHQYRLPSSSWSSCIHDLLRIPSPNAAPSDQPHHNDPICCAVELAPTTTNPGRKIYIRADRVAFVRPDRWEPWNDERIPAVRFIEYFRMSRADFLWDKISSVGHVDIQGHTDHKTCSGIPYGCIPFPISGLHDFSFSNNLLEVV
ncbi:hypothetical protein PGT21_013325 [Puccinia graminis f. sp. tritici]|uniref:Uncharacterized protein n=2 Tax=Puccinia graminis f. sp. tritici TaxID=56615 RepID=E3KRX7_PUCGT|nr:uncharacterized protein PGTG_13271 [Puccinia graminis f. sp. tritici CRL 75-36-700-3]EFP87052.1 hypothetical protein PGTG_13271 [Puccinia graminis f. sp. tritici CRL 75-36-700-3]KAA1073484.1 hypothetical protein PGT21_013325 [Puccinia graminis f. sp. tritici]